MSNSEPKRCPGTAVQAIPTKSCNPRAQKLHLSIMPLWSNHLKQAGRKPTSIFAKSEPRSSAFLARDNNEVILSLKQKRTERAIPAKLQEGLTPGHSVDMRLLRFPPAKC